jgi:hypothetical protein
MKFLDINKLILNTRLYDENGVEAFDGDIILKGERTYEVYWDEQYQWSIRNLPKNQYGYKQFSGRLTSSKYIVPKEMKWKIIKRRFKR